MSDSCASSRRTTSPIMGWSSTRRTMSGCSVGWGVFISIKEFVVSMPSCPDLKVGLPREDVEQGSADFLEGKDLGCCVELSRGLRHSVDGAALSVLRYGPPAVIA